MILTDRHQRDKIKHQSLDYSIFSLIFLFRFRNVFNINCLLQNTVKCRRVSTWFTIKLNTILLVHSSVFIRIMTKSVGIIFSKLLTFVFCTDTSFFSKLIDKRIKPFPKTLNINDEFVRLLVFYWIVDASTNPKLLFFAVLITILITYR